MRFKTNRNRKPVSDEIIVIGGLPYRRLSDYRTLRDGTPTCEAVDPFGNQEVLIKEYGRWHPQTFGYLTKSAMESMRLYHPEIAEQLDTDFTRTIRRDDGGFVHDYRMSFDTYPVFVSKETWVKDRDAYILQDWCRYVGDHNDWERAEKNAELNSGRSYAVVDDVDIPGCIGIRIMAATKGLTRIQVDRYVQCPFGSMDDVFKDTFGPHPELFPEGRR